MIYGYLRVSTDKQDVEVQKQGVVSHAEKQGWKIDDWITDDGISGTKDPEKRQLGILVNKCKEGDVIICSELSRLGRKMLMVMSLLQYCMKNGIMIHTVKDNYVLGDNVQSHVLAFAFSLAAQIERDMISLRTIEGLKLKKLQGVLLGTKRGAARISKINDAVIEEMKILLDQGNSLSKIGEKMKIHRLTVGYHLARKGYYKGALIGYQITTKANSFKVTSSTSIEYGFSYSTLKSWAKELPETAKVLGIEKIEPLFDGVTNEIRNYYNISEHVDIDRDEILNLVEASLTIPEIHKVIGEKVDYFTLYDYISGDTEISSAYRVKGHLKVKSTRERY